MRWGLYLLSIGLWVVTGCASGPGPQRASRTDAASGAEVDRVSQVRQFLDAHTARVAPVERAANLAYWKATTQGDKAAYAEFAKLNVRWNELHSDPAQYAFIKAALADGTVADPLVLRQLLKLRYEFEKNQIDPALMKKIVSLSTEVQKAFNEHRGRVDGQELTDNQIKDILASETDSARLQSAWEAYKSKGAAVEDRVRELVRLRNQAAVKLGYDNYYQMSLKQMEQDDARIQALFDDLARQTDAPFAQLMKEVRTELAAHYGVAPEALMPWHFQDPFFQQAPRLRGVELDPYYAKVKLVDLAETFCRSVGLDPAHILKNSDLYEKPGKMPHAYCTNMDRGQDVRILANLKNDEQWASTLLHELGHGVYDLYLDPALPWLLRVPSHSFATEAVAMLLGRQTRNPVFLEKAVGVPAATVAKMKANLAFSQRLNMLVFARWAMVMMNFERRMYQNPDQDLNKLWWDLKQRYQLLEKPAGRDEPDWASKIHVAAWPAYYHNYLLGELMASQVLATLAREVVHADDPNAMDLAAHPEVGAWMKKHIFSPGASLRWDTLIERATGEPLDAKYFAQQFID